MRPHLSNVLVPAAVVLAALAAPLPAFAVWPHDTAIGVPVAPGPVSTLLPNEQAAVPDGMGGVFVPFQQTNGGGGTDLYLQRMTAGGVRATGWPASGVLLRSLPSPAGATQIVPDGAGGAIAVWWDLRTGNYLLYGQRMNASGATQWAANGVNVTGISGVNLGSMSACTDGAGGAFIAFAYILSGPDVDVYASHLLTSGSSTLAGVSTPLAHQTNPSAVSDGAGGFYVAYEDDISGNNEIKLSRLNSAMAFYFSGINLDGVQPNDQYWGRLFADGAGGVYATWIDDRAAFSAHDLYITRIDPSGARHGGIWTSGGNPLVTQPGTQGPAVVALDGTGGAYALWNDGRPVTPGLYGAHLNGFGVPFAGWPVDGKAVNTFGGNPFAYPVADGAGGVLLPMYDIRVGSYAQIYAERLTSAGNLAPLSLYGGRPVVQQAVSNIGAVTDGVGGAFIVWNDFSTGVGQVYVQHLDHYATIGDSRPAITGATDVGADQGGHVRLGWNASWMDADPDWGIGSYWIWRQTPAAAAQSAIAAGYGVWADEMPAVEASNAVAAIADGAPGRLFQHASATAGYAWEFLASQPGNGSAQYSYVASTSSDSITGSNPYTVFMVEAHSAINASAFWQSAPDSGYSTDDLAPAQPVPFTGTYAAGTAHLHWGRNLESDLLGYRLYRGSSIGFVPSPGNLVSAQPDTGYADPAGAPKVYKLTAVDVHGNESLVAVLALSGSLDVGDQLPQELGFSLASANPSHAGAVLRFALPAPSHVRVAIYDLAGREVRLLTDGPHEAGEFTERWNGSDESGASVASGVYFAKLQVSGQQFVRRIAITH